MHYYLNENVFLQEKCAPYNTMISYDTLQRWRTKKTLGIIKHLCICVREQPRAITAEKQWAHTKQKKKK